MTESVNLIDSHCHLDLEQFDEDRSAVLDRAESAAIRLIVNPGIDLRHCQQAIALAQKYSQVYATVGIHPNSSGDFSPKIIDDLRLLAVHPKVVAIGEIGLDYYWKQVEPKRQKEAFRAQLALAAELGLPVIIHCRDANEDVMEILGDWVNSVETRSSSLADRRFWGVLHAFPGDLHMAEQAYDWNFVVGLGGPVTYKNAKNLHALVPQLRLDRLMLETDAPYLTPHPHRGARNEPAHIKLICEQIAHLRQISFEEVARQTTEVATQFFKLEAVLGGISANNTRSKNE